MNEVQEKHLCYLQQQCSIEEKIFHIISLTRRGLWEKASIGELEEEYPFVRTVFDGLWDTELGRAQLLHAAHDMNPSDGFVIDVITKMRHVEEYESPAEELEALRALAALPVRSAVTVELLGENRNLDKLVDNTWYHWFARAPVRRIEEERISSYIAVMLMSVMREKLTSVDIRLIISELKRYNLVEKYLCMLDVIPEKLPIDFLKEIAKEYTGKLTGYPALLMQMVDSFSEDVSEELTRNMAIMWKYYDEQSYYDRGKQDEAPDEPNLEWKTF